MTPKSFRDTMEMEFDEKFPFAILDWRGGKENDGDGKTTDKMQEIKSFINQSHDHLLDYVILEVGKMKWPYKHDSCIAGHSETCDIDRQVRVHNAALSDVITLLESLKIK